MNAKSSLAGALFTILIAAASSFAQDLEREPLSVEGTFKGPAPGGTFQVAVTDTEAWLLKVDMNAQLEDIKFSGTAEKSFLRPGVFVEFRAKVSKRGTVMDPVAELTVFTPSEARPPGLQADGDGGGGLFNESKEEAKPDPKEKKAAAKLKDDTVYRIAGAISKVGRVGDITVNAAGAQVKFTVAEDCRIQVDVNELSYLAPGDKVSARGWFYKGRPGQGMVSKVEVTAANPLTDGSKKKPTRAVKESKTGTKADKDAKNKVEKEDKGNKGVEDKKDVGEEKDEKRAEEAPK